MNGWARVPFLEAFSDDSAGNKKLRQAEYLEAGQFSVVDQGEKQIAGYTDDESYLSRTTLPVVVFGDHTRRFKFVDHPFVVGADGVKVLTPKPIVDAKYGFHFLQSISLPSAGYSRHFKFLREVEIPLPSLPEQRRIADILDRADDLRAQRRRALQLHELARSEYFSQTMNDSSLGRSPLRDLCTLITKGTTPTSVGLTFEMVGVPFIRAQNVSDGEVTIDSDTLHISENSHSVLSRSQIRPNDVLVTIAGTIGRVGIVGESAPSMNCNQAVAIVRVKPELSAGFVCEWLGSASAKRQMFGSSVTATIANLSLGELGRIEVPIPSEDRILIVEERIRMFDQARKSHHRHLATLDELFASLQHRAFRGEL